MKNFVNQWWFRAFAALLFFFLFQVYITFSRVESFNEDKLTLDAQVYMIQFILQHILLGSQSGAKTRCDSDGSVRKGTRYRQNAEEARTDGGTVYYFHFSISSDL